MLQVVSSGYLSSATPLGPALHSYDGHWMNKWTSSMLGSQCLLLPELLCHSKCVKQVHALQGAQPHFWGNERQSPIPINPGIAVVEVFSSSLLWSTWESQFLSEVPRVPLRASLAPRIWSWCTKTKSWREDTQPCCRDWAPCWHGVDRPIIIDFVTDKLIVLFAFCDTSFIWMFSTPKQWLYCN